MAQSNREKRSEPLPAAQPLDELTCQELRSALDEEIARLPEKYRAAIVLCYFEGLTHDQAAESLRWPVGTVRGYLARARDLLRTRLIRRGVAPAMAVSLLSGQSASAAVTVTPALVEAVVRAVTSRVTSTTVAALAGSIVRSLA